MWSTAEVARMSGVSSRTLRHYHAIDLLVPAEVRSNGWRYYDRQQLLRLQQILLLRELDLGLGTIADVLASDGGGSLHALRRHRELLASERRRLAELADTVDATIETLETGRDLMTEALFNGFRSDPYEDEARERWGDVAVDAARQRMRAWSADDAELATSGYDDVRDGLAALRDEGAGVDDERVQLLVDRHYRVTCLFWTPDAEAYRGLAQLYVEDERFRSAIGQGDDALVRYLRDAMLRYADIRLP